MLTDFPYLSIRKAFFQALSSDIGIPISELIQIIRGGFPELQGTWVHPDITIHLAQWLSPKFAVKVFRWVREWLTTGKNVVNPRKPEETHPVYYTDTFPQLLAKILAWQTQH